jgi:M6 family metalloprotease-like protein
MIRHMTTTTKALACAVVLGTARLTLALPASPHPYRVTQPDGTVITVYIRGDEYFHWEEDEHGYTILRDAVGAYVYATLDAQSNLGPTSLKVGVDDPRSVGLQPRILPPPTVRRQKRLQAEAMMQPQGGVAGESGAIGTFKNVVIMMRFSNHLGRTLPSDVDIGALFNNVGPHAKAPTGSVRDLYLENSYGQMTLDSSPFGWVDVPQTEQHYAAGNSGLGTNVWPAITDALDAADTVIDFSQYDDNGDNFVDAIAFIHSGYAAEWGGTDSDGTDFTNRIWSHRWSLGSPWVSAEGVMVSAYHISPGLWGTSGSQIGRIGVISHETGHFFGLPDLYDTDNNGPAGIGSWCMMSNSWGWTGDQLNPPHFSAWCKQFLGWTSPTVISAAGTYSARRAGQFADVYRINAGYPAGEYLLVENRQPYGFEDTMPQGGLCVWHIDEFQGGNTQEGYPGQPGWPGNNRHYMVALLQADGNYDLEHGFTYGDPGDVYHAGGVDQIDGTTIPNTHAYQGGTVLATNHRLHNISASGTPMTFDLASYVPATGACCNDLTGVCTDNESSAPCMQSGGTRFVESGTCAGLFPPCTSSIPENDDCAEAVAIFDGFTFFDNRLASTDGPSTCTDPRIGRQDLWYIYEATCSGNVLVSLCPGTDFDSTLQVYQGTSCTPLGAQLGCSDDDCGFGGGPSEVTFSGTANDFYMIRVGGYQTAVGSGFIDISCDPNVPPPDVIPSASVKTRTLSFSAPAATTASGSGTAIKFTMMDLQNPIPPNNNPVGPCCPPGNFVAFDTAVNSACSGGDNQGYRCTSGVDCPGGSCPTAVGCTETAGANAQGSCARWLGPPLGYLEANDVPALGNYRAARLQCAPYYHDWSGEGVVHATGAEIVPSSAYAVEAFAAMCKGNEATCQAVSNPVVITTRRAGDIATPFQSASPPLTQPNALDVTASVNKFRNLTGAMPKIEAQVQPNFPDSNADINAIDIVTVVDNVRGFGYSYSGPCLCPSTVPCDTTACSGAAQCTGPHGPGATCVKTCSSGPRMGQPCNNNLNCGSCIGGPTTGAGAAGIPCDANADCASGDCGEGTCPTGATPGFCRDRCGRCD